MANVLDNAIEACENVKGSRSITMQISRDAFELHIYGNKYMRRRHGPRRKSY
ncbi:MAG: GHKL domain-containing protein [Dethiobacteria bacterium]